MDCDDLKIPADQQRCDFMLVGAGNWVAPIELKSGNVELHDAVRQLQVGARLAERRLVPRNVSPRFRPVVVYRGRFRGRKGKKATRAETVQFRGNAYEVKAIRCGSPLIKALG